MTEKITDEFLKYRHVIFLLLNKIRPTASKQDIEDILQETYVNTYQSSLKKEIVFPKAFMVKTAIRLANKSLRKAQRVELDEQINDRSDQTLLAYEESGFSSHTEQDVLNREEFGVLCEAINQLPIKCRKVFILKKIYGLSQKEIAQKLSISESTVEKHVAKGLLQTLNYYNDQKNNKLDKEKQSVAQLDRVKKARKSS